MRLSALACDRGIEFGRDSAESYVPSCAYNDAMANSIQQLSFELTASELSEQERSLAELKTSAGTIVGAASIAGSFLGTRTGAGLRNPWAVLALASFALCFGCAIWVLLPHDLVFAVGGQELLAASDSREAHEVAEAYRAGGRWIEPLVYINREKLARLSDWLTASCVLLGVEVVLWTLSVAE